MEWDEEVTAEKILKIVVCGDSASGKTSVCRRFVQDYFDRQYQQTVGLDFLSKRLTLPGNVPVLLQIWDIGGQSIASPMLGKYISGAHGALVVYDVTSSSSFENLKDWIDIMKEYAKPQEKPIVLMLVGNKTDLEHRRSVRIERHTKFAIQNSMFNHYVSAKTGDSVLLMFRKLAAEILGIPLEENDKDADIAIVKAYVTIPTESEAKVSQRQTNTDQSRNTAVCSLM
ncbi:unnamed protein product [Thelazia callipaeda]|uniref:Ras-related protein Rab-28 n=1 Tax=Thelazia callipaeda TaxID=103827 RepID=A0A0N5D588_THECL|nr:unnamed protein product [Thelazia callipaeda]